MQPYAVELTIPADNSWAIAKQQAVRDYLAAADASDLLPAVKAVGGSGSGELVLRWTDLQADGAWMATRLAVDRATQIVPELASVPQLRVSVEAQDPDVERRRPEGS